MRVFIRRPLPILVQMLDTSQNLKAPLHSTILASTGADDGVASSLCETLRKGLNWNAMSNKFGSARLSDDVIEKVLLEFKQPTEARKALSFFHWVSHFKKHSRHRLRAYCIAIHILTRARLTDDASALMESVLSSGDSEFTSNFKFSIVDCLLTTYKITDSCPFVFDLLVRSYSKLRMIEAAFEVCHYVDKHGFTLTLTSFNILLHVTSKSRDEKYGDLIWKLYEHMVERRVYGNQSTMQIMVSSLCKRGELQKFVDVTCRIHGKKCSPTVVVNTCLVTRMLEEGKIEQAMLVLKRLLQKNMILDTISYSLIVSAKVKEGRLDSALVVYDEMLKRGFSPNSFVYTTFIETYCKEGMLKEASDLFKEMINQGLGPYADTYNSLILGYAKLGKSDASKEYCEEMIKKKGMLPRSLPCNEMVRSLCEDKHMSWANNILTQLLENGFTPDELTYLHLIEGYAKEGNIEEMLKLYYEMEFRTLSPGVRIFTPLIIVLCEHGRISDAERFLSVMGVRSLQPNASIYKFLIASHRKKGNEERACQLHNEMVEKGIVN